MLQYDPWLTTADSAETESDPKFHFEILFKDFLSKVFNFPNPFMLQYDPWLTTADSAETESDPKFHFESFF